jgi:hypothetical protein
MSARALVRPSPPRTRRRVTNECLKAGFVIIFLRPQRAHPIPAHARRSTPQSGAMLNVSSVLEWRTRLRRWGFRRGKLVICRLCLEERKRHRCTSGNANPRVDQSQRYKTLSHRGRSAWHTRSCSGIAIRRCHRRRFGCGWCCLMVSNVTDRCRRGRTGRVLMSRRSCTGRCEVRCRTQVGNSLCTDKHRMRAIDRAALHRHRSQPEQHQQRRQANNDP